MHEPTHPDPLPDDYAGLAWWSKLSEIDRAWWLGRAGSARPIDAWAAYQSVRPVAAARLPAVLPVDDPDPGSAGAEPGESFEVYAGLIRRWAQARRIIPNSSAAAQIDKAFEELSELRAAIESNDSAGIIDGFGDTEVCLINARALAGVGMVQCLDHAWDEIKDRTGRLGPDGIFYKDA